MSTLLKMLDAIGRAYIRSAARPIGLSPIWGLLPAAPLRSRGTDPQ
jgi:hypothetical protein